MGFAQMVEKLQDYCAVRGREEDYLMGLEKILAQYGNTRTEGTYALCEFKGIGKNKKKILLIAHVCTPGFLAGKIADNGHIAMNPVDALGNRWPVTWIEPFLPIEAETFGKRVCAYGKEIVAGVVPVPPIHYQYSIGNVAKADGMYMATGGTKEQVEKIIVPGDAIDYEPYVLKLLNGDFAAPWVEYRAATSALIELARLLSEQAPYHDVTIALTGGTEYAGAMKVVKETVPDEIIVISSAQKKSFRADGIESKNAVCQFFGSALNYSLSEKIENHLINKGFEVERVAALFTTDTPADECGYQENGYPTAMFGVPVKYAKSSTSIVNEKEIEYMVEGIKSYLAESEDI